MEPAHPTTEDAVMGLFNRRHRPMETEFIGDTADALRRLSTCPEACRRLAVALELEGDESEIGDFLRQMAESEGHRADADMKQRWADEARAKVMKP